MKGKDWNKAGKVVESLIVEDLKYQTKEFVFCFQGNREPLKGLKKIFFLS